MFDATHRLLLELVAAGAVTGLRVDHPDGLYLPRDYFEKLQHHCAKALGLPLPPDGRAIYLPVEKILSGNETLRKDWPVHGTTGYEFGKLVAGLLVDAISGAGHHESLPAFHRHSMHFGHLVYAKKRLIMRLSLANDVNVLGDMLDRLSEKNRWFRDFTLEALARAVRETIACFPVYRTYVTPGEPVSEEDRAVIERAVDRGEAPKPSARGIGLQFPARYFALPFPRKSRRRSAGGARAFRFEIPAEHRADHGEGAGGHGVLYLQPAGGAERSRRRAAAFRLHIDEFHQRNLERQRDWPATLLATSTHDTKRSEDVRARMVAISEVPQLWRGALQRWRVINRRAKRKVDDAVAPDANEEYLLYQTLLGTWPMDAAGQAETRPALNTSSASKLTWPRR